ncbi:unnamed protein product [Rotaria sp. Silwood1]|nr:unnamed protein product [Rotaria sp. Silwood1]
MNIKSTRSTTDFTQTTIDSLLLPLEKEKQPLLMMCNSEQVNIDSTHTTINFDGHGNPKHWLKHMMERFNSSQLTRGKQYELIPDTLTNEALI